MYLASDEVLNREVAFKQIRHQHADHPESRARFLLEAEVTGGLEHPSIVPVYALGSHPDGRPYYAMRFIQGDSLKDAIESFHDLVQQRHFTWERSLELRNLLGHFIAVCNAIEYAHSRGILHRDLKPSNIMLGRYGETLVVDWGLAKAQNFPEYSGPNSERRLRPKSSGSTDPTQMGSISGTPQYMSPEQAEGRLDVLGPVSDVYSLGATLYTLLTGRVPFVSRDVMETLKQVRQGEFPPPRAVLPSIPRPLEAIALKAMALRPADRYDSARRLADDLERWLADEPVSALPESWPTRLARWGRRHRTLLRTGAVALAVITLIAVFTRLSIDRARRETDRQRVLANISFHQARSSVDGYYTHTSENRLLNEPGLQDLRRDLLHEALGYYQGFLQQRSGDPSVQEELATANFRVGKITADTGSKLAAFASFEEARRLQEDLSRHHPAQPRFNYELSNSWNELGRLYLETGDMNQAQNGFQHRARSSSAARETRSEQPGV